MPPFSSRSLPRKAALLLTSALLLGLAGFSAQFAALAAMLLPDFADWTTNGELTGDDYGQAVYGVGDLNADGYADILVGAPKASDQVYKEGVAYAFHGSLKGLSTDGYDWIAGSGLQGAEFGRSLAGVGDVDHDGYADVLIGAPAYIGDFPAGGAAFLYHGSPLGLETSPAWVVQGDKQDVELGRSVDGAGDIDDNSYLDLAIGVHHYTDGEMNEGQVRVYFGSSTGFDSTDYWGFTSDQSGASLGAAVAGVGDLNGDGFDDLAAAAPYFNHQVITDVVNMDAGAVYVFYGTEVGLPAEPDWMAVGNSKEEWFGTSLAGPGDLNQDGYDDLLVGAPGYDAPDTPDMADLGAVYIYLGSAQGLPATPSKIWVSPPPSIIVSQYIPPQFGASVSGVGDINQDGLIDVVVGAPTFTQDQSAEGGVFVYFGKKNALADEYGWRNFGQKADTLFGAAVGGEDVNGDGCQDVLVGAPKFRIVNVDRGRALAYYGMAGAVIDKIFIPLVSK